LGSPFFGCLYEEFGKGFKGFFPKIGGTLSLNIRGDMAPKYEALEK